MAQVFEGLGGFGPWLGAGHTVRCDVGACLGDDEMSKIDQFIDWWFSGRCLKSPALWVGIVAYTLGYFAGKS